ncbi:MAG: DUF6538 domain-containing protein [Stenotrophomonas sp.]|uniref:DUF6538 domain-containing protein n=1 Tax=Stenotrophomonas sp. TaxID=69392 RepID=UPI003D6CFD4F
MTARSYLYRRNGIYYFRWPIPLACQQQMPPGSPIELRTSLRTSHPGTARHLVARHWLAALDVAQSVLVSRSAIRYNDLLNAIKRHAGMNGDTAPAQAAGDTLITLGEMAGTVEVQQLKDALAALERVGATFYIAVSNQSVEVWGQSYDDEGAFRPQIIEALADFTDDHARLTRDGIRAALAADKNSLLVEKVHSDQPGLQSSVGRNRYYEIVLASPITRNLSELKVASAYARQTTIKATPATTSSSAATDCEPIALSEAKETWVKENRIENGGIWKKATVSNYDSYVQQFIVLVGDKLTTELQAKDFASYEKLMRTLPADWYVTHKRTGLSPAKIALSKSDAKLSPKTLKDKGSAISLFFSYLQQKGFWHGRYGAALFTTVKASKAKKPRHVFSNDELKILYAGAGIETFRKAKFPLYVWGSILLLFTGARPAEISQLQYQDVTQDENGTWYLRLMPDDEGEEGIADDDEQDTQKQFKTASSLRSIPLHTQVIQLGFLSFIQRFKSGEQLFPEAFRHNQKISREIGDWFNGKLLKNAGLKKNGVVLYCLRHTVINRFKADATMDHYACAYTGHSTADDKAISNRIYRERYGRAFKPTLLAEKLHPLLDFDIDWSHLKGVIDEKGWASPTLTQPLPRPRNGVPRKATPRNTKLVAPKP